MNFSFAWICLLRDILVYGSQVSPRGQLTKEILHKTISVNMRTPVLRVPARNLSYKFMAAEAYWILTGDNRVSTIAPYNSNISKFSDDGLTFFGAYGPRIFEQLEYVVTTLNKSPQTRQAGLTLWQPNPPETKDVPCTVSIFFSIRRGTLDVHVFMRSSDAWLGVPYDVFNFSMLGHLVCAMLNTAPDQNGIVSPGTLWLTAMSSHLYEQNWAGARICVSEGKYDNLRSTPERMWTDPAHLIDLLGKLRDTKKGDVLRWWETVT